MPLDGPKLRADTLRMGIFHSKELLKSAREPKSLRAEEDYKDTCGWLI